MGADAALLMFDVNDEKTLKALERWWEDFKDKAPLREEDMEEYCCVVVGNKMDLASGSSTEPPISRLKAESFLNQLIPPTSQPSSPSPSAELLTLKDAASGSHSEHHMPEHEDTDADADDEDDDSGNEGPLTTPQALARPFPTSSEARTSSIAIVPHPLSSRHSPSRHSPSRLTHLSKSRSRSSSRFYGTMTTTHTTLTIYHTPSSSLFDNFESARSSPEPWTTSSSNSPSSSPYRPRRLTALSNKSSSSESNATVTPSLFARECSRERERDNDDTELSATAISAVSTTATTPESDYAGVLAAANAARVRASPPDRGPKLFFTSAKTGEGVRDVFEYIAQRVIKKWEYDEMMESRRMSMREAGTLVEEGSRSTVNLNGRGKVKTATTSFASCCSS
ncbi:hypothetical protein VNI00_005341 [Paramarasmius palmivorus]|uniref:Ras-domain-containing protein n=1 Tax=Paramarasmius palmivorus TaxID=297713 RepID=A0AAW0DDM5_9AGAR